MCWQLESIARLLIGHSQFQATVGFVTTEPGSQRERERERERERKLNIDVYIQGIPVCFTEVECLSVVKPVSLCNVPPGCLNRFPRSRGNRQQYVHTYTYYRTICSISQCSILEEYWRMVLGCYNLYLDVWDRQESCNTLWIYSVLHSTITCPRISL